MTNVGERLTAGQFDLEGRPLPAIDGLSAHFWKAAAQGVLALQQCGSCHHVQHYPRSLCQRCGGEVSWIEASGEGSVYTFSVVRRAWVEPFVHLAPYAVAMIRLDEGPLMMGAVVGCVPDDVAIDMRVVVRMAPVDDDLAVPYWIPVTT